MKTRTLFLIAVLAIATLLIVAGCGGSQPSSGKTSEVTLTLTEFKFTPDTLNAKVGEHVKVTLDNTKGTLKHNLKQADLNIDTAVEAGQTATFEFTPTQAGTFNFICDVPGHKEAGMVGKIVVQP
jgi:uncharacterized cupredoxin-like copper-binding protein